VCRLIVEKFDKLGHGDVSYADIAKRAWEVGRASLATKVILGLFKYDVAHAEGWFCDSCWIMSRVRLIRFRCC
jgi:hypothetical protein